MSYIDNKTAKIVQTELPDKLVIYSDMPAELWY